MAISNYVGLLPVRRFGHTAVGMLVMTTSLVLMASVASACEKPERPTIPEGSTASQDDMRNGLNAVKVFQEHNKQYMKCLEADFNAARQNASSSPDAATRAIAQAVYVDLVDAYKKAASLEEEVAGDFNIELREFKALQQK